MTQSHAIISVRVSIHRPAHVLASQVPRRRKVTIWAARNMIKELPVCGLLHYLLPLSELGKFKQRACVQLTKKALTRTTTTTSNRELWVNNISLSLSWHAVALLQPQQHGQRFSLIHSWKMFVEKWKENKVFRRQRCIVCT